MRGLNLVKVPQSYIPKAPPLAIGCIIDVDRSYSRPNQAKSMDQGEDYASSDAEMVTDDLLENICAINMRHGARGKSLRRRVFQATDIQPYRVVLNYEHKGTPT